MWVRGLPAIPAMCLTDPRHICFLIIVPDEWVKTGFPLVVVALAKQLRSRPPSLEALRVVLRRVDLVSSHAIENETRRVIQPSKKPVNKTQRYPCAAGRALRSRRGYQRPAHWQISTKVDRRAPGGPTLIWTANYRRAAPASSGFALNATEGAERPAYQSTATPLFRPTAR